MMFFVNHSISVYKYIYTVTNMRNFYGSNHQKNTKSLQVLTIYQSKISYGFPKTGNPSDRDCRGWNKEDIG